MDSSQFGLYSHRQPSGKHEQSFNPIVVNDVIYLSGRDNSLIALDATTGKEIWIPEGLSGMQSRGINHWQSEDGKDRRLISMPGNQGGSNWGTTASNPNKGSV